MRQKKTYATYAIRQKLVVLRPLCATLLRRWWRPGRKTERNDIQLCAVAATAGLAAGAGAGQRSGGGALQLAVKVLTWGKKVHSNKKEECILSRSIQSSIVILINAITTNKNNSYCCSTQWDFLTQFLSATHLTQHGALLILFAKCPTKQNCTAPRKY